MRCLSSVPRVARPLAPCSWIRVTPLKTTRLNRCPTATPIEQTTLLQLTEPISVKEPWQALSDNVKDLVRSVWKFGWVALFLASVFLPWTKQSSSLSPIQKPTENVAMTVENRTGSLSKAFNQPMLRSSFTIQMPAIRLAAYVGTAMIATSAARKWRSSATADGMDMTPYGKEMAAKHDMSAWGVASSLANFHSCDLSRRSVISSALPQSSVQETPPRELDISLSEYDALAAILKRTKESSKIDDTKLDPIRKLLRLKESTSGQTPFRSIVDKIERDTAAGITFFRQLINWLTNPGRAKYDWFGDVSKFTEPPAGPTSLRGAGPPPDSKFDFLVWLLKGNWRAPRKDEIPYWDPVTLLTILNEQPAAFSLDGGRFIRTFGEFPKDSNPYDPLQGIDRISSIEESQKYDPLEGFLDGKWHIDIENGNSVRETRAETQVPTRSVLAQPQTVRGSQPSGGAPARQSVSSAKAAAVATPGVVERLKEISSTSTVSDEKNGTKEKAKADTTQLKEIAKREAAQRKEAAKRQEAARHEAAQRREAAKKEAAQRKEEARRVAAERIATAEREKLERIRAAQAKAEEEKLLKKQREELAQKEKNDEQQISFSISNMEKRLNVASSLLQETKQTIRAKLKAEIASIKRMERTTASPSQGNGSTMSPEAASPETPVADNINKTFSQISNELDKVSEEIKKLYGC